VILKIKADDPRLKELLNFERSRHFLTGHPEFIKLARTGDLWGFVEKEELLGVVLVTKQRLTNTIVAIVVHKNQRSQQIGTNLLQEMFNKYPEKQMRGQTLWSNVGARKMATGLGCIEEPAKNGIIDIIKPVSK
jgi:ribosomal protein S18 acetylase RimI-like enzyme